MPYLTATGQIRVLEKKLLDETDIERMVDAKNADEAFKVFSDTDLAENIGELKAEEYQKVLDENMAQTRKFLEKAITDENLSRLMFLKYDFHNIKLLLKMKYFEIDLSADLTNMGMIQGDDLKTCILNQEIEKLRNLSTSLKTGKEIEGMCDVKILEIIDKVIAEFDAKKADSSLSPADIDMELDKEYFKLILDLAKKIKNDFILNFVKRQIDVVNIRALIRIKNLGRDKKYLKPMLISGGNIEKNELIEYLEKDLDELINYLHGYLLGEQERFLKDYADKKILWQLEKGFNDLEMDYIKGTKWLSYGPEIIFGYWYAKKNAARNVRLIMTGKLNNIPADEIKQRVRDIF